MPSTSTCKPALPPAAAALVQVANTASNPVISQGIGNQAAQIVEIECGLAPGSPIQQGCTPIGATGLAPQQPFVYEYVVPAGETLVVTSVDILSGSEAGSPCMSPAFVQVVTQVLALGIIRKSWIIPAGTGTAHYVYPSGILFSPGTSINGVNNGTTTCTLTLDMHGYLTAQ
jgi:hypothetical protein